MSINATLPGGTPAPSSPAGAAAEPVIKRVDRGAPKRPLSTDDFVDGALAAMASEEPENEPTPAPKQSKPKTPPKRAAEEPSEEPDEGDEGDDEETELPDAAEADEDDGDGDGRGTQENPYKLADLPKDKYIEIKVDGEKKVVKLEELASGYIAEKTFKQRLTRTQQIAQQAEQGTRAANTYVQRARESLNELLSEPDKFYGWM